MKVEIRDITKEEAVPYGDNADIVLAERKAVVFTDDAGNTEKLYMKEEDVELLGEQYIAEDGNCIRPNVTFRNGTQTETVLYDDWNGTAAYNSTFNPNFKKGE